MRRIKGVAKLPKLMRPLRTQQDLHAGPQDHEQAVCHRPGFQGCSHVDLRSEGWASRTVMPLPCINANALSDSDPLEHGDAVAKARYPHLCAVGVVWVQWPSAFLADHAQSCALSPSTKRERSHIGSPACTSVVRPTPGADQSAHDAAWPVGMVYDGVAARNQDACNFSQIDAALIWIHMYEAVERPDGMDSGAQIVWQIAF